ncbi:MAG: GGDEF domain-containing protein [Desulfobacteraceae bacterium]|nr:GGDEF domain-containing protein [Desulfobacteraceae bacterium]
MLDDLNIFLAKRSSWFIMLVALILVAVLAVLDLITGYELLFSIFYIAPIAFAAWYGGALQGVFFGVFSAAAWLFVDWTGGHRYSQNFIPFWNAGVWSGFFIIIAMLIEKVKSLLEAERRMARIDALTGAMNLRSFMDAARKIFQIAARYGHSTVIGYIDVDNFKSVNDTLGHAEGNNVLKTVASILLKSVRGSDFVGRLGGDEFVVLLPETHDAGAAVLFDDLRHELLKTADAHGWPIGFSIGVAVFQTAPVNVEEAIKLADALMYRVKNGGKNHVLMEGFGGEKQGEDKRA